MESQFEHIFENLYSQNTPDHQYRQPTPHDQRDPRDAEQHRAFDRNTFTDWEQDKEPTNMVNDLEEQEIVSFLRMMRKALERSSVGDFKLLRKLVHSPEVEYEGRSIAPVQYILAKYGHLDGMKDYIASLQTGPGVRHGPDNMKRKVVNPGLNQ